MPDAQLHVLLLLLGIVLCWIARAALSRSRRRPRNHNFDSTASPLLNLPDLELRRATVPRPGGSAGGEVTERARLWDDLSAREQEIARAFAGNWRADEIAADLNLSPNTVKTHLRHIYTKLGIHSKAERLQFLRAIGEFPRSRPQ